MAKTQLTKEESDLYIKIIQVGTMDDMFDFAYSVGRERLEREQLDNLLWRPSQSQKLISMMN